MKILREVRRTTEDWTRMVLYLKNVLIKIIEKMFPAKKHRTNFANFNLSWKISGFERERSLRWKFN